MQLAQRIVEQFEAHRPDAIFIDEGGVGGGVSLSAATCAYNGGAAVPCSLSTQAAPTSAGKTLLLGVTVTVNASQTAGTTATPTFTITVVYT